jgi:elongation factor Ts
LEVSLELVKKLREKTGAGIADCKKALIESGSDFEKAIEFLRKKGAATSQKRSDRIAKEGIILSKTSHDRKESVIIELNCETDFVARSEAFVKLSEVIVNEIFNLKTNDINQVSQKVKNNIDDITASVGEKIEFKRMSYNISEDGFYCEYNHLGNKVASLIELTGEATDEGIKLGTDLAMQVVAMKPLSIDRNGFTDEMIGKEKEIYRVQAINEGKPENIAERIASNRIEKFYEENCLLEQEFVKESGKSVKEVIKQVSDITGINYSVKSFIRYQLGETISQ